MTPLALSLLVTLFAFQGSDTDGDGLADALELGSDSNAPDALVTVQGYLRLPNGAPAADAHVRLLDVASESYHVRSAENGFFSLPNVPAGLPWTLSVRHFASASGLQGLELELAPHDTRPNALRRDATVRSLGKRTLAPRPTSGLLPGPVTRVFTGTFRSGPFDVALGDLDQDGFCDAVLSLREFGRIDLRLGRGDGSFADGESLAASSPQWLELGDLDGDGALDLAVSGGAVELRFGAGDGTFGEVHALAVDGPRELVFTDVDLDGQLDLAVVATFRSAVDLFRGDGRGGFAPVQHLATSSGGNRLAVGDLDGDCRPELLTTHSFARRMSVLPNLGGGAFGPARETALGDLLQGLAVGDLDGDGANDALVALFGRGLLRLRGRGDLGFEPAELVLIPASGRSPRIADLDRDGDLDAVVAIADSDTDFDDTLILRNDGHGNLAQEGFQAAAEAQDVGLADLDRDGWLDLCFPSGFSGGATSFLGDRRGGFVHGVNPTTPPSSFGHTPVAGDVDRDGHLDVLFAGHPGVEVWRGDGTGAFTRLGAVGFEMGPPFGLRDLDRDGTLDLVRGEGFGPSSGLVTHRGLGDGSFAAGVRLALSGEPVRFELAPLDRDLWNDALVLVRGDGNETLLVWLRGKPDGTFEPPRPTGVRGNLLAFALGPFDGDRALDLVIADRFSGQGTLFLGTGDGRFLQRTSFAVGAVPMDARIVDLDGDGRADLAFACAGEDRVVWRPGGAGGTLGPARAIDVDRGPHTLAVADLDLDGRLDLLVGAANSVSLLRGDGARGFEAPLAFQAGSGAQGIAVGDWDEDGAPDLVLGGGGFTWLRNLGAR